MKIALLFSLLFFQLALLQAQYNYNLKSNRNRYPDNNAGINFCGRFPHSFITGRLSAVGCTVSINDTLDNFLIASISAAIHKAFPAFAGGGTAVDTTGKCILFNANNGNNYYRFTLDNAGESNTVLNTNLNKKGGEI